MESDYARNGTIDTMGTVVFPSGVANAPLQATDPTPKELIITEDWGLSKYPYMVHAEQSALIEARRVHKGIR